MYKLLILLVTLALSFQVYAQSPDEFEIKEGDTTYVMKKYFLAFYKRGPNQNLDSLQTVEIQAQHMVHLNKMAEAGQVVIAGPIDGDFDLRGILIFDLRKQDEVEKLMNQDPAVKAGKLTWEAYPWWAAKGSKLP